MEKIFTLTLALVFFFLDLKVNAQVNIDDSLALVDLYNSTNGPGWKHNANWLTAKPVSTWYGVTVDRDYVVQLQLYGNKLNGTLPKSIGNISNLQDLNLQ